MYKIGDFVQSKKSGAVYEVETAEDAQGLQTCVCVIASTVNNFTISAGTKYYFVLTPMLFEPYLMPTAVTQLVTDDSSQGLEKVDELVELRRSLKSFLFH